MIDEQYVGRINFQKYNFLARTSPLLAKYDLAVFIRMLTVLSFQLGLHKMKRQILHFDSSFHLGSTMLSSLDLMSVEQSRKGIE